MVSTCSPRLNDTTPLQPWAFPECPGCARLKQGLQPLGPGWSCKSCADLLYLFPPDAQSGEISRYRRIGKSRRFYKLAEAGICCGLLKGYRFRWFVLSESDLALEQGLSFGAEFHNFRRWLSYYCSDFQYIVTQHHQGLPSKVTGRQRSNYHILSYGSDRLPVLEMRDYWLSHYSSTVTGLAEVKDIKHVHGYLSDYLAKDEKFVRTFQSQGWVFPGWIGWTKAYHGRHGIWLRPSVLARLVTLSPRDRLLAQAYMMDNGPAGGLAVGNGQGVLPHRPPALRGGHDEA